MTKLIETDEEVEKAVIPGRSSLRRRRLGGEKAKIITRLDSGMQRLGDGQRYRKLSAIQSRLGRVRKSADPLSDLYTAIEKARGLMPKGVIPGRGSKIMLNAVRNRAAAGKVKTKAGWSYKRSNEQSQNVQRGLRARLARR